MAAALKRHSPQGAVAARGDASAAADTQQRILDAAEALFAEHGFEAASMRMIAARAGANLAAANYHFGSKEGLLRSVFQRRLSQLNSARLAALELAERDAGDQPVKPARIVDAFFGTALRFATRPDAGGPAFMRLLARTSTEPAAFIRNFLADESAEVIERFKAAMFRALPDVPPAEIAWRFHFMLGAMSYALAGVDTLQLLTDIDMESALAEDDMEPRLMSFLLGGLRAPLPATAKALARR